MRFFKRANPVLYNKIDTNGENLIVKFYRKEGKGTVMLPLPFSDAEFRNRFGWDGFEKYLAYERLVEEGLFSELGEAPLDRWFDFLSEDTEVKEQAQSLGLPLTVENLYSEVKISGSPAKDPHFQLHLKTSDHKVLSHLAEIRMPLIIYPDRLNIVSREIWELHKAINSLEYSSGYEKTAKVQKLANSARTSVDNFMQNEKYHYVDTYEVVPHMHAPDHLELKIKGPDENATVSLNNQAFQTTVKRGAKRERYETSPQVREDIRLLSSKRHLRGEEVPQFFENPLSLFPEHEYLFDLEQFSERVTGFTEIKRPRMMQVGEKRSWFDTETGETIELDEDVLRTAIKQNPDHTFVPYRAGWVFVNKKLKEDLGLLTEEDKQSEARFALDIKDNEDQLEYEKKAKESLDVKYHQLPRGLKAELFPHQQEGYNWLCALKEAGNGGLLADDMGLGKTLQVITFLLKLKQETELKPTLIVLPIALIGNWIDEISKFAPGLSSSLYVHKGSERHRAANQIIDYDLIFTSYDTLKIDQLIFGQIDFKAVIADEAQNVKSYTSQRSRAIRALKADFRLAMTGTPVENGLEDLWTIMDFVQPGVFGSLSDFKRTYIKNEQYSKLMDKLQPFYLRRTKEEVLKDRLPAKHIQDPQLVRASELQKQMAATMVGSIKGTGANVLNVLTVLRQMYGHPGAIKGFTDNISISDSPKLVKTLELLDKIKSNGEKVLIFTEFRQLQTILKQEISRKYGISVPVISGETNDRPGVVRHFNESPGFGVMVLSPKAAGVGLTITSANHVIHYTRWWNPAVENQATDRVYRIGQEREVFVHHIITTDPITFPGGTVEEIMNELLTEKSSLADNVIIPFDTEALQKKVLQSIHSQRPEAYT